MGGCFALGGSHVLLCLPTLRQKALAEHCHMLFLLLLFRFICSMESSLGAASDVTGYVSQESFSTNELSVYPQQTPTAPAPGNFQQSCIFQVHSTFLKKNPHKCSCLIERTPPSL
jgi:hypothetical protein